MVTPDPVPALFVYSAGGVLTTAVATLFAWVKSTNTRVQRKLDQCEEEHKKTRHENKQEVDKLRKKIEALTVDSIRAQTCPAKDCPIRLAFPHRSVAAKQQVREEQDGQ
jgi:hypothetical protein